MTTAIRSASWAVWSRWAIATTVRPVSRACMEPSSVRAVRGSMSEVASSSTSVCGSATTSRASATCWACAGVSWCCPDPTVVDRPSGSRSIQSVAPTAPSASRTSWSSLSSLASTMFSRRLPTNTWCSWVTRATSVRRTGSGSFVASTPPMRTVPSRGALMPASSRPSVDLPEPDGPTIASRSPGSRSSVTPWRTSWPSRYANRRSRPTSRSPTGTSSPATRSAGTWAMPSSRVVDASAICSRSRIWIMWSMGPYSCWLYRAAVVICPSVTRPFV